METTKSYRKDYSHEGLGGTGDNKESFGWQEAMLFVGGVLFAVGVVALTMMYIGVFSN